MDNKKLFGLVSLSRRAGKLIGGFDAVKDAVRSGKAYMVIFAEDISPKTASSMRRTAEEVEVKAFVTTLKMEDYAPIFGKDVGVFAVIDEGFANGIEKIIGADDNNETDNTSDKN